MRVLNKAVDEIPPDAVYIGRPSKWGNPFVIGKDGTRSEVIKKYRQHLKDSPALISSLGELAGRDLVCWCSPQPCHGDVLVQAVEQHLREEIIQR